MWNFDQETWIYIGIIVIAYFFYRSSRGTSSRKNNRRAGFRERYNERRKETRRFEDDAPLQKPRDPKEERKDRED